MQTQPTDLGQALRLCLRRLASTVTVLTAGEGETAIAMTATAFTSIALEPTPTVLVCVNRSARLHAAALRTGGFRVNVLSDAQTETARACGGGDPAERLRVGAWRCDQWPGPRLEDCVFDVACRTREVVECGSHGIFIGEVVAVRSSGGNPLIYIDGEYGQVTVGRQHAGADR